MLFTSIKYINYILGIGIGIRDSAKNRGTRDESLGDEVTIASEPENYDIDILERRNIIYATIFVGVINLLLTSLMYSYSSTFNEANSLSLSLNVTPIDVSATNLPYVFEEVSNERRPIESRGFAINIVSIIIGIVSALIESPLGLSIYALSTVLYFLLGTTSIPYFLFSYTYILDLWMLYLALLLRSKLVMTFLNMKVHRIS
jgi:hypothetical protein